MRNTDPVTGLPFKDLVLYVGVIEVISCCICANWKVELIYKYALIAGLASDFLLYRLFLKLTGWKKPCVCMGGLFDGFNLATNVGGYALWLALLFMLFGAYISLYRKVCKH